MDTKKFSNWVASREQRVTAEGPEASLVDAEIKQVIASNAGKSKGARQAAMKALVKKKQGDPRVKPADLEKIASAFPSADDDSARP